MQLQLQLKFLPCFHRLNWWDSRTSAVQCMKWMTQINVIFCCFFWPLWSATEALIHNWYPIRNCYFTLCPTHEIQCTIRIFLLRWLPMVCRNMPKKLIKFNMNIMGEKKIIQTIWIRRQMRGNYKGFNFVSCETRYLLWK